MDPTSATGDGTREGIVKEVAGVTVALVDKDPECETEDGVEERGGVEKPDWDPPAI